eukprot:756142-Hanusia_phi.AAC.1
MGAMGLMRVAQVYERNAFARRALQQESHVLALKLLLEQAITYRDGLAKYARRRRRGGGEGWEETRGEGSAAGAGAEGEDGVADVLDRVSRVGRVTNRTLATYRPDAYSSCANDKKEREERGGGRRKGVGGGGEEQVPSHYQRPSSQPNADPPQRLSGQITTSFLACLPRAPVLVHASGPPPCLHLASCSCPDLLLPHPRGSFLMPTLSVGDPAQGFVGEKTPTPGSTRSSCSLTSFCSSSSLPLPPHLPPPTLTSFSASATTFSSSSSTSSTSSSASSALPPPLPPPLPPLPSPPPPPSLLALVSRVSHRCLQECDVFKAHQYHYAVDGNPSTQ